MSHSNSPDSNNALVQHAPPAASADSPPTSMPRDPSSLSPARKESRDHVPPPGKNDDDDDAAADVDDNNDSEAETLISSPVKKREMLKQRQAGDEEKDGPDTGAATNHVSCTAAGPKADRGRRSSASDDQAEEKENGNRQNRDRGNDSRSDGSSDVSSVRSSDDGNGRPWASEQDDDGQPTNRRKRKHADLADAPRQRRRARDHSREDSSSPQLRRHRRTTSVQSARPSQSRSNSGQHAQPAGVARQRRAATYFPVRDAKLARSVWDSDTSSETSHQHPKNRLTRNTSRAVSTPGRPMGRDPKRHVNKYGFTRLAEACESGELDMVKEWHEKDPEQLEQREFAGNTPLQVASLNGYPEIVEYLLGQGCTPHCANADKDTPLIDAVENGHLDVVHILLKAGVNPLRQNLKGQQALDVVTDQTDNSAEIRAALRDAIEKWAGTGKPDPHSDEEPAFRPGPTKGLQFLARTYENLLKLVGENDRTAVQEFLDARVPVDNTVVAAAARTGDLYLVNMLSAEMTPKKARQRAEKPMLAVIGTSHFEMVKALTELDQFNPTWRSKSNGLTWHELAESRQGPNWREEKTLLLGLFENRVSAERLSSSPVHRREAAKKRRRSTDHHKDSDVDMEDADSPERARSRRRLVSKKDMRATSRQRSSSASSDPARPRHSKDRRESGGQNTLRPSGPRKVGRPRKHSNSHLSEPQPKRHRSSSVRDKSSAPSSAQAKAATEAKSAQTADEDIKLEEPDREAVEAEAAEKAAEKAAEQAELEAKVEAERIADEKRKAEEARKEEEAMRRREAERKAEEMRLKHEQKLAEERRLRREEKLQTFPSALSHVLELNNVQEGEKQTFIQRHFLPIQVVKRADLRETVDGEGKPDDLWMLNYQAAAILTGVDADFLFDISTDAAPKHSSLSDTPRFSVTDEQRRVMLACLQSTSLVHDLTFDNESAEKQTPDDLTAELAAAEKTRRRVKEDRSKFLTLESLRWMRFSDFYNVATSPARVHLVGLSLDIRFDCCLDQVPFTEDSAPQKAMNGTDEGNEKEHVNGTANTNGAHENGISAAGPGITTITVVQD